MNKADLVRPLIKNIAFFGDAEVSETSQLYRDAFAVAKMLAKRGYTIVNGGGPGVMNASTQGAEAGGGETLSVTFYPKDAPGFEGKYLGNITDREVKTANYIERMFKLMEHAHLFILFKGGSGTVSEFGTAWVLGKLYYGHHKPFILYGAFWKKIVEAFKENMNIDKKELDVFRIVEDISQVVPVISEFEKQIAKHDHKHCRVCSERAFMT